MVAVKWRIQGREPGGPPFPLFLEQNEARRAEKIFFEDRPSPLPQSLDAPPPHSPPSEGLDPPLQSNNRSQKFLLESGRRIGFFRLGRQIRLLYNKALEICIKHEKEKSRFLAYIIFFHLPVSGLDTRNVFLFHSSPGLFPKKNGLFPPLLFFLRKSPEDNPGDKVPPRNLISQADHPNCSRHLDVTCKCIHTFTVRKHLLSA